MYIHDENIWNIVIITIVSSGILKKQGHCKPVL